MTAKAAKDVPARWASPDEAAEFTGLSKGRLANLRSANDGPPYSGGGRGQKVRYWLPDVHAWMRNRNRP